MPRLRAGGPRRRGRGPAAGAATSSAQAYEVRGRSGYARSPSPASRSPQRNPSPRRPGRARAQAWLWLAAICAGLLALAATPGHAAGRVVRVGVYENPPKLFTSSSGRPAGIFADIIELVARSEGWRLSYVRGSWAEGLDRLSRGEIDLMPDVAFTSERDGKYSFHTVPVLSSWDQVYAGKRSGIRSILDLNGRRIAVLGGSVQQEAFTQLAEEYGLKVSVLPRPDYSSAFAAVAGGEAAAVIANNYYGATHYREFGLENTAVLFNPSALFFAAPKGADRVLLDAIDRHLRKLKDDPRSEYYASLEHWIGEEPRVAPPPWLWGLGLAAGAVLLLVAAWSAALQRQVGLRTRALTERNAQLAAINQALHEGERKYRELVEHANSIILHLSSDGTLAFMNEFGLRFFGYSEEEIIGRHVVGTIVPESESTGRDMRTLIDQVCADPSGFEHNINENMRRNGERVWIEWTNKIALDSGGQVEGILSIGTDITERRRAEEELRRLNSELERKVAERTADLATAKERAESADRLKSAFLAAMSHELRTPLNSIIGFTGIILQGLTGPLNEEQTKQLGMVQGSARHLLDLINDVLDLSKIEAGQLRVEAQAFDVPASVAKVVRSVELLAEKKGLGLSSEIAPQVGEIVSDRRRFEQVLINLLSNAVKFSNEGHVRVECGVDGQKLVTRVSDTGIGIRPEDMDRLFSPFQQLDTGLTRNHEGSGLGLSICKKLVEMMGGGIAVESEWGVGTTVTFTLPLDPSTGESDGTESSGDRGQRAEHVPDHVHPTEGGA